MSRERYTRRLQALATGGGWLVERDGRAVALLTDPQPVEMFWCAWRLEPRGGPDNLLSGCRRHKRVQVVMESRVTSWFTTALLSLRDPDNKLSGPPRDA
jgi:hypothetical protein